MTTLKSTNREIKSEEYNGLKINFRELLVDDEKTQVHALYSSPRHKERIFEAIADNESEAFEKIKKVIDEKEQGEIPQFKPFCWECKEDLTSKTLYVYMYWEEDGKKRYFCKKCARNNMMATEEEFDKKMEKYEKETTHKAVLDGGEVVWKKVNDIKMKCPKCGYDSNLPERSESEIKKVLEMIPKKERDFIQQIAGKDERHEKFIEKLLLDVEEPILVTLEIDDLKEILKNCDSYDLIDGTKIPEGLKKRLKGIIIRMEMPVETTIDEVSKVGEEVSDGVIDANIIWCARISKTITKPKMETLLVR